MGVVDRLVLGAREPGSGLPWREENPTPVEPARQALADRNLQCWVSPDAPTLQATGFSGLRRYRDGLHWVQSGTPPFQLGMQMNYIDAGTAPMRKTGHVKIHGPEAFAGMHKAGRLAAECLDMLVPEVRAGVTTDHIDRLVFEFALDHGSVPATLMYQIGRAHV